jgi:Uma2 family endonuclease
MLRLAKGLVRIPDVSFITKSRLPGGKRPRQRVPGLSPSLAIEVLSEGNTEQEMSRKLNEYFDAGAQLVWFVDPPTRTVTVYNSPTKCTAFRGNQPLTGGRVVPGFKVKVAEIFSILDQY